MFQLTMLPASDGDCLVLTWGDVGSLHHMVVDGGRMSTWPHLRLRLEAMASAGEPLERLILTHIDADHIKGLLGLTRDKMLPLAPNQVWYNGLEQMTRLVALGERQGGEYSDELNRLGWVPNADFHGNAACVETAPVPFDVAGLQITMLSPDRTHLAAMAARWSQWYLGHGPKSMTEMGPRPIPQTLDVDILAANSPADREPPNGSSIAFVAEYDGRRVLLAGDAHPDMLEASLKPLADVEGGRYRIDLLKVSHHGSRKNTSVALSKLLDCRRFAFSSDGSRYGHPDVEAVARLLKYAPPGKRALYFNYLTKRNAPWDNDVLKTRYDFSCRWPADALPGELSIDVMETID